MRKFKNSFIVLLCILFFSFSLMGCGYTILDQIENYDYFMANLVQYNFDDDDDDDDNDDEEPKSKAPAITGFESLYAGKAFSEAYGFSGEYAFAKYEQKNILLSKDGSMIEIANDLSSYQIICDKYIYEQDGYFGVKDVFDNEILPAEFDFVQIVGETILAQKNGTSYIYKNEALYSSNQTTQATLVSENFIEKSGQIYDLDFLKPSAEGYEVLSTFTDGMFLIYSSIYVGIADAQLNVIHSPAFEIIYNYVNGWLCVRKSGTYQIISPQGEVVFSSESLIPLYYDGSYAMLQDGSFVTVSDSSFVPIDERFLSIASNTIFGDYIIVGANSNQFYSIKEGTYSEQEYKTIQPMDDYFICGDGKYYSLLNSSLNVLMDNCEYIQYNNEILVVQFEQQFYYYKLI